MVDRFFGISNFWICCAVFEKLLPMDLNASNSNVLVFVVFPALNNTTPDFKAFLNIAIVS